MHQDTIEQQAIFEFVARGQGNLLINALAGTGKTYSLLKAIERIPQRSILMCAFNKRIETELVERAPKLPKGYALRIKTFHAQGLAMLRDHFKGLSINNTATEEMINRVAEGASISFRGRRAATRLLQAVKDRYAEPTLPAADLITGLALDQDLFKQVPDREQAVIVELVCDGYALSLDFKSRTSIDFSDMVWGPVACGLKPRSRYLAVFVDELQDVSQPQFQLLRMLMAPKARFIGVGDPRQQIYGWRGSLGSEAWQVCKGELQAQELPLTMTWRCAHAVVDLANTIVPELRARPDAAHGLLHEITWEAMAGVLGKPYAHATTTRHTFVLSRTNAALLDAALFLWRKHVKFELNAGRELFEPLFTLLDNKLDLRSKAQFRASLNEWRLKELARAEATGASAYADRVEEQAAMLEIAVATTEPTRIKGLLMDLMAPNTSGILLSTVHKVKGLEADRVLLLKQTFARYKTRVCYACSGAGTQDGSRDCPDCDGSGAYVPEVAPEELNIEYVAITRARDELVWVNLVTPAQVVAGSSLTSLANLGIKSETQQLVEVMEREGVSRETAISALTAQGELARECAEQGVLAEYDGAIPEEPSEEPT